MIRFILIAIIGGLGFAVILRAAVFDAQVNPHQERRTVTGDGGTAGMPVFTLECATISAAADTTDNGSIINVGQAVVGTMVGEFHTIEAGIIPCLAAGIVADVALPPTVSAVGPRYLEVIPATGESEVALLVTSDDEPCVSLYVQAPEMIGGHMIGRLGASPVLLTPAAWGTVNVSDEAILPGTSYNVQSELAGSALSEPTTATTWLWADANNSGPPTTVDFDDIVCILDAFADSFPGVCTFFGSDLEGGLTNVTIDFDDVVAALDAFAGAGYFDNPTHVDPCP